MPEERAMCDGALFGCDAGVPLIGIPGVEMAIEMDNRDGAVDFLQAPQDREDDAVVAA